MRVQIAHRVHVGQPNHAATGHGLGQSTTGRLGGILLVLARVTGTDPPQRVAGAVVLHKRDNLLARPRAELLFFRVQVVARVGGFNFNGATARDVIFV